MKLSSLILLLLLSTPVWATTELLDYIVAIVNDEIITHSALAQEVQLLETQARNQKAGVPPRPELEKQVLDNLIMTALQLQLAQRTGIVVEDSALNETLRNMATQNQMDLPTFRQAVERDGYIYEKFRDNVRNQMIIHRLQQRQVVNRISVTPKEIDNFLANQTQQGNPNNEYHLLHILIAIKSAASPEEIEAKRMQAEEVLKRLKKGEDFKKLAKTVSNSRTALQGGDLEWLKEGEMAKVFQGVVQKMAIGELQGPLQDQNGFHLIKLADKRTGGKNVVTQTKVRHILLKMNEVISDFEAQTRLEGLKSRIDQGDDFAELARANSEDTTTAANGGSLDWVNPGEMVPEFEEVMNNLSDNQVSTPFKSRFGWHLIQVLERRQFDNTQEALRVNAANQIKKRKIEEELQTWLRQLRDESYVEVKTAPGLE